MVGGCVSSSKFEKKVAEADGLNQALQALQQKYDKLTAENNDLKNQFKKLSGDFAQLSIQKDKITADRDELDKVLKSKSDSLSKTINELRGKAAALEM
jgi:chemotaxis protein MotB